MSGMQQKNNRMKIGEVGGGVISAVTSAVTSVVTSAISGTITSAITVTIVTIDTIIVSPLNNFGRMVANCFNIKQSINIKHRINYNHLNQQRHCHRLPCILLILSVSLSGCGGVINPAPVSEAIGELLRLRQKGEIYIVREGDTLAEIAFEHGLDYRDLALWNGLADPNSIYAGNQLRLKPPSDVPKPIALAVVPQSSILQPLTPALSANGAPSLPLNTNQAANNINNVNNYASGELATNAAGESFSLPSVPSTSLIPAAPSSVLGAGTSAALAAVPLTESFVVGGSSDNTNAPTSIGDAPVKKGPLAAVHPYSAEKLRALQKAQQQAAQKSQLTRVNVAISTAKTSESVKPPQTTRHRFGVDWSWPSYGTVTRQFSDVSKGLDLAGRRGDSVFAAATGKVVYVGAGVKSYGRLVIIKHDNNYLSAYAHNEEIRVQEGDKVKRGDLIATVGDSGADQTMLHLEIRKAGKPLNPMHVLPDKQ